MSVDIWNNFGMSWWKKGSESLKQLFRLIILLGGVKHRDQKAVSFNEGLELFDCEGQYLQNEEEDDEDFNDGERSEDQDTVISEAIATDKKNIIPPAAAKAIPIPNMLADLC